MNQNLMGLALCLAFLLATTVCGQVPGEPSDDVQGDRICNYEVGYFSGAHLRSIGLTADAQAITDGLRDRAKGKPSRLALNEQEAVIAAVNQRLSQSESAASLPPGKRGDSSRTLGRKIEISNSYLVGYHALDRLGPMGVQPISESFVEGFLSGFENRKFRHSRESVEKAQAAIEARLRRSYALIADRNKRKEFPLFKRRLAGMKKVEEGLYFRNVKPGHGDRIQAEDSVLIRYRATTLEGKDVDITFGLPHPVTVAVSAGLMRGLKKGLLMMREGQTSELLIASDLAYGDFPEEDIEPGTALFLTVTALEVERYDETGSPIDRNRSRQEQ